MKNPQEFLTWAQSQQGAEILPAEFRVLAQMLVAKEITGFVCVAETVRGEIMDATFVDLHSVPTNRFTLLGGIESVKHDLMARMNAEDDD